MSRPFILVFFFFLYCDQCWLAGLTAALDETEMSVTDLKLKGFGRQQDFSSSSTSTCSSFPRIHRLALYMKRQGKFTWGFWDPLQCSAVFFDYFFSRYIGNYTSWHESLTQTPCQVCTRKKNRIMLLLCSVSFSLYCAFFTLPHCM